MRRCMYCDKELLSYQKKYCSVRCQQEYHYLERVDAWKKGLHPGYRSKRSYDICNFIRRYLSERFNKRCQKCSWGEINAFTGNIPLTIHHVDGDPSNNSEDNLQLLCPNCHALTKTYCGGNKNKSKRAFRRQ